MGLLVLSLASPVCRMSISRVPRVREKSVKMKKFKVREKSGNFDLSQGILKFGKSQGKVREFHDNILSYF